MENLYSYITILAPSLVSIIAIVISLLKMTSTLKDLSKSEEMKQLTNELKTLILDNKELKIQNDILIDEIKKIKNYRQNRGFHNDKNV